MWYIKNGGETSFQHLNTNREHVSFFKHFKSKNSESQPDNNLTQWDLTSYFCAGFQPTFQTDSQVNKQKLCFRLSRIPAAQLPQQNIQTGWFSLLWISPLFAGRLTLQWTKPLIHGKKGTVSVGTCFILSPHPTLAKLSLLVGLLSLMFSLGFGSSAPTAKHPKQTRLKFWGLLNNAPFGLATKPTKGRAAKASPRPKHKDVGRVPRKWPESIQEDGYTNFFQMRGWEVYPCCWEARNYLFFLCTV